VREEMLLPVLSLFVSASFDLWGKALERDVRHVSNAVFALVSAEANVDEEMLTERTKCIEAALGQGPDYEMIIFHEGTIHGDLMNVMQKASKKHRFVHVAQFGACEANRNLPPGVRETKNSLRNSHMCHFNALLWQFILSNYEYVMRVDDDVCLKGLKGLSGNPFELMRERKLVHAYANEVSEGHEETCQTMNTWLQEYSASHNLTSVTVDSIYSSKVFVTSVEWWQREEVKQYLEAVDSHGGIYTHNWGDAAIMTAALKLFGSSEQCMALSEG